MTHHQQLEADRVLLGGRVARALYKENRSRRKHRINAIIARMPVVGDR